MEKSHVSMGFTLDPVTMEKTDEAVLLDRRLKNSMERETFMGWKPSQETEDNWAAGLLAFVEARPNNPGHSGKNIKLHEIKRTGRYFWLSQPLADRLLKGPKQKINIISPEVGDFLVSLEKERPEEE